MNRYRQYSTLDDVPEIVGDIAFNKLDMLTDPAELPPGALTLSENLRFDAKGTSVRGGISRQFPAGTSIGTIYHAGIFKPDTGDDQFILATGNRVYLFHTDTRNYEAYNYPSGETIAAGDRVDSVQAGVGSGTIPTFFILRGLNKTVLKWDAGSIGLATGFPNSEFALFYGDRIAANDTTQSASVSDFLGFTVFNVLNQFQILKGGDDYLTCFIPYQKDYVLIGGRKSWSIAFFDPTVGSGGYVNGLKTDTSFLRQLTREAGPVGPRAAIEALGNIWFITDNAIYAFTPQLDNQLTVLGKPISADIQPIMDRMSAKFARGAAVQRWGYRLYFALPISSLPISITNITVAGGSTSTLDLPFDLPVDLIGSAFATVTTAADHDLKIGDIALISGAGTVPLNGEATVVAVPDSRTFQFVPNYQGSVILGSNVTVSKIAQRNNTVAVYNLNNQAWESIDTLPTGFFVDWLLAADYGTRRRLWVVDANSGPALYEEADADETGGVLGGVDLPFDLPIDLSESNFSSVAIPGKLRTRALRWGAYPRKIKNCEVRATLGTDDALSVSLLARSPNNVLWTGTRDFIATQFDTSDVPLRKTCGQRALEAQVEINVSAGRPTVRSVLVETVNVGKVEE